jgi:hypothetical protein
MIRPRLIILALLSILLLSAQGVRAQAPTPQGTSVGSDFTYQGQLKKGGQLYNGTCDFLFGLYDAATAGNQIGVALTQNSVNVSNGVFAVKLGFGLSAFNGAARWLQLAVKCPGDAAFIPFNTRQELTPSPYAISLVPGAVINAAGRDSITGRSDYGRGLAGYSDTWQGVYGFSKSNAGLVGESNGFDAVFGISHSATNSGVAGFNDRRGAGVSGTSSNGDGVVGRSTTGRGLSGFSDTYQGVFGFSRDQAGVVGESTRFDAVFGISHSATNSGVAGFNDQGGAGISGSSDKGIGVHGRSVSGYAGFFEGKVRVSVLEIAGGADLAEPFDVRAEGNASIAPGTVVCIDPANPGKLIVCANAYDRTVAGVISGAGGIQPGMVMQQDGSAADGQHPVALIGRVYVWADATQQPIHPGDLLTTATTSGHAAKAIDHDRAQGAIIGKAMSSLESGKGLVLVLVGLN